MVLADAKAFLVFTNRWATWCWRVHLAAPDLDAGHVLAIAKGYAMQEQAYDLLSERPPMDVGASNAWLVYRPDLGPGLAEMYDFAMAVADLRARP